MSGRPENGLRASGFCEKKCSKSGHRIRKNKKNKKNRFQDEWYTGKSIISEFDEPSIPVIKSMCLNILCESISMKNE